MPSDGRHLLVLAGGICRGGFGRVSGTDATSAARTSLGSRDVVEASSSSTEVASPGSRKGPQPRVGGVRPRWAFVGRRRDGGVERRGDSEGTKGGAYQSNLMVQLPCNPTKTSFKKF